MFIQNLLLQVIFKVFPFVFKGPICC